MLSVNIREAKTHLCRLLRRVEAGEHVVIARDGTPVARLVPLGRRRAARTLGLFDGQPFEMADDFDRLPDDVAAAFEGEAPGGRSQR